jgi:hypothetical protein
MSAENSIQSPAAGCAILPSRRADSARIRGWIASRCRVRAIRLSAGSRGPVGIYFHSRHKKREAWRIE